jgi:hypothetical protein
LDVFKPPSSHLSIRDDGGGFLYDGGGYVGFFTMMVIFFGLHGTSSSK